jgi:signal transduction histidine kinase
MSLRSRIILAFLIVIVGTNIVIAVSANRVINARFNALSATTGTLLAQRIAPLAERYYAANGTWEGMDTLFKEARSGEQSEDQAQPPKHEGDGSERDALPLGIQDRWDWRIAAGEERLILIDMEGQIVVDTHPDEQEIANLGKQLEKGVPLIVQREKVGVLVPASAIGALTTVQNKFLQQVNVTIIGVTILGSLIAIIVASLLAQRTVAPIQALAVASQKVAAGDYSQRVEATGADEIVEMANSFNTMASELQTQRDLRYRSMADLAHELRTPLSVLQIELESIEDGLSEPTPEVVKGLQVEVIHLNHLVEDLRTLSLMDAGELTMDFHEVDLSECVKSVVNRFRGPAMEKDISLVTNVEPSELLINGDDHRLTQVLINLLSNAIRHTPNGGTVTVNLREDKNDAIVTVRDTGEGIDEQHLPHLFERLYRADNARDRRSGGSGLGLSIARSLVEAHNGQIWVKSQSGQGALFGFTIPLKA